MTADEVAALKLGEAPGGMQGLVLQGPDDKLYSFIIRPLLPAETEWGSESARFCVALAGV
jgi:hypothetical protein